MSMTPEEAAAAAIAAAEAAAASQVAAANSASAAASDRAAVSADLETVAAHRDQVEIWKDSVGQDKAAVTILRDATADDRAAALSHKNAAAASRAGAAEDRTAVQAAKEQVDIYAAQVAEDRAAVQAMVEGFDPETDRPLYQREIRFLETPVSLELLDQIEFVEAITLPANLSSNRGHCRGVAPSSNVTFSFRLLAANGTDQGVVATVSYATNRAITRATVGNAPVSVPEGGTLQLFAPADAKGITNVSEVLVGTRTG